MNKKINKSAYYFLNFLLFIIQNKVFDIALCKNFLDDNCEIIIENKTILKYIRTAKKLGFAFEKINSKTYELISVPIKLNITKIQQKLLYKLINISYILQFSEKSYIQNLLWQKISLFLPENTAKKLTTYINNLKIYDEEYNSFLNKIKEYCIDEQRLKVTILNKNSEFITFLAEPYSIEIINNIEFLNLYNITDKNNMTIPIKFLTNLEQTPVKNKYSFEKKYITLKIFSDLAKNYILKDGEEILEKNEDFLLIRTFYFNKISFFKNILRYMNNCKIMSPLSLSTEFKAYVNDLYYMYD